MGITQEPLLLSLACSFLPAFFYRRAAATVAVRPLRRAASTGAIATTLLISHFLRVVAVRLLVGVVIARRCVFLTATGVHAPCRVLCMFLPSCIFFIAKRQWQWQWRWPLWSRCGRCAYSRLCMFLVPCWANEQAEREVFSVMMMM